MVQRLASFWACADAGASQAARAAAQDVAHRRNRRGRRLRQARKRAAPRHARGHPHHAQLLARLDEEGPAGSCSCHGAGSESTVPAARELPGRFRSQSKRKPKHPQLRGLGIRACESRSAESKTRVHKSVLGKRNQPHTRCFLGLARLQPTLNKTNSRRARCNCAALAHRSGSLALRLSGRAPGRKGGDGGERHHSHPLRAHW